MEPSRQQRQFDRPFAYTLSPNYVERFCSFCLKEPPLDKCLYKCGKCYFSRYCGKECQTRAWKEHHKAECRLFLRLRQEGAATPSMEVLFFARMVAKLQKGARKSEYDETKLPTIVQRRTWDTLMSHKTDILAEQSTFKMGYFESVRTKLESFLGAAIPQTVDFFEVFGKKITNSYGISDNKGTTIGEAIDLYVSAYDHSCRPNIGVFYDGYKMTFRALEPDVDVFDTSKAFTNYIELMASKATRRRELEKKYFFKCQCRRCTDPKDDILVSIKCVNPSCKELVLIDETYIPQGSYYANCPSCLSTVMAVPVLEAQLAMRKLREFIDEDLPKLDSVEALKQCIQRVHEVETMLPPINVYFCDLCTTLLQYALRTRQELETALAYGKLVIPAVRMCYPPKYKSLGFHLLKLAYLHVLLRQYIEAIPFVDEAVDIFDVCFGPGHAFSVRVRNLILELLREDVETLEPEELIAYLRF